jgi:small subunit ribosomal protein S12
LGTLEQLNNKFNYKKKSHCWTPRLNQNPQKRGTVLRVRIITPRKPNSARRPVAKIFLCSKKKIAGHIPGIGHNLRRYSTVLVRGGGARDLPGSSYSCIRGVLDFLGVLKKTRRRSIYGVTQSPALRNHIRRKVRRYS